MPKYPLETMFVHPIWGGVCKQIMSLVQYLFNHITYVVTSLNQKPCLVQGVDIAALTAGQYN